MAWRLARSLQVLEDEIDTVAPGTTYWTIGDEDHQQSWSDHNPNECCDVVCAADILGNAGLDLAKFVATIVATDPPALKYVIYRDRIWFPQTGWQPYRGQFHSHVHVSVGWGPDGRSIGNYDDTSPWGLLSEEDDMSWSQDLHVPGWVQDRWGRWPDGTMKAEGAVVSGYAWSRLAAERTEELAAGLAALAAKVGGKDIDAALTRHRDVLRQDRAAALAGLSETLGPAILAGLRDQLGDVADERLVAAAEAGTRRALGSLDEPA